jgi:hypothetical protein
MENLCVDLAFLRQTPYQEAARIDPIKKLVKMLQREDLSRRPFLLSCKNAPYKLSEPSFHTPEQKNFVVRWAAYRQEQYELTREQKHLAIVQSEMLGDL